MIKPTTYISIICAFYVSGTATRKYNDNVLLFLTSAKSLIKT